MAFGFRQAKLANSDQNNEGFMTELNEIKEIFDHFDKDGNGIIDAKEFRQLLGTLDSEMSEEEIEMGLLIVDANGNGIIEYDEFITWWSQR